MPEKKKKETMPEEFLNHHPIHKSKDVKKKKKRLSKDLHEHSDASSDTKCNTTNEMGLGQITKATAKYPNLTSVWSGTTL